MFLITGNIVHETEKESIRNRGCRVLANLCQTIACCDIIHEDHAKIFRTVVSDLCKTTNNDCKVTYCRLIRYTFRVLLHRYLIILYTYLRLCTPQIAGSPQFFLLLVPEEQIGISGTDCFLLHDAMLIWYMLSSCVCPSVLLSVHHRQVLYWND